MASYLEVEKDKSKTFNPLHIAQVPRDQNTQADALPNLGSSLRDSAFTSVPIVHLMIPAISKQTNKYQTLSLLQQEMMRAV